ncbi:MAG: transposase [Gammaproteobacteria bacterium]|nr:transposase [Gammaproteobacteria bacterium]
MTAEVFAAALGIESPWSVAQVDFDQAHKLLTIQIDFKPGSRFTVAGFDGGHPVHDTVTKTYRHLNFFQPEAQITFDKFHVIAHASQAVDRMRRIEQRSDPSLKGLRWSLLKDRSRLSAEAAADLEGVIARLTTVRTARAWVYKEQLREILERKQINVVRAMLQHWCTCVMRSKVEPMKAVAAMVRNHLEGIVAWAQTRQTNGFLEAINGLFQATKRRARGFTRMSTIRTVIFLIAGKLNFSVVNPHVAQPT